MSAPARTRPAPSTPLARRGFDQAERAAAQVLEGMTASRGFTDLVIAGFRVQRAARGLLERHSHRVLHLAGLPSRGDVSRLNRQIVALTAEVRELAAQVAEQRDPWP
jgi:hypothetical protein